MSEARLPDDIKPVLESEIPAKIVTCAPDGIPNVTILSKVHWVDQEHVALSFQFFSKTIRNVRENPRVNVQIADVQGGCDWDFDLVYVRSETEGPTFEAMDMAIEAIASMTGMSGIFKLKAADIYEVRGFEKLPFVEREPL